MEIVKEKSGSVAAEAPTQEVLQDNCTTKDETAQVFLGKDVVAAIKAHYPGFDHSLWSKSKRPDLYGITLTAGARKIADGMRPRKKAKRRKDSRWSFRVTKATHSRLQTAMQKRGITSKQTFLEVIILKWLEEEEDESI